MTTSATLSPITTYTRSSQVTYVLTPSSSRKLCRYSVIRSIICRHRATVCRYSLPCYTMSISYLQIHNVHQFSTFNQCTTARCSVISVTVSFAYSNSCISHSILLSIIGIVNAKFSIKNNFQLEYVSHRALYQANARLLPQSTPHNVTVSSVSKEQSPFRATRSVAWC